MDITSFILGYQKGIASGSGAAVDPIHTVTFMNGSEVIGQRSVVDGDDCADMVARGKWETPTRDSTAQYNYTYSGWSSTSDGEASSSALSAVTEDRTVYAAFTAKTRTYAVRFYDGETLLHTAYVAYGGSSSYTYTKAGYLFEGWTPEPKNVTAEMDCYGTWIEKPNFANSSWEDIARISEAGKAAETFALGDSRAVAFKLPGGTLSVSFTIVGFNHDDLADGSGKAGISVISNYIYSSYSFYQYDSTLAWSTYFKDVSIKLGCWDTAPLRTFCDTYIYSKLPSDLKEHVKEVKKQYYNASEELTEINDKIWIPSISELVERGSYTYGADGTKYAYFDSNTKRKKTTPPIDLESKVYGTRSPSKYMNTRCCSITTAGAFDYQNVPNGWMVFGFCI